MGGNGNGNGSGGVHPQIYDAPWEEVRAFVWHFYLNQDLAWCAGAVRFQPGERWHTGYSEARLIASIDLAKMLNRLAGEIGYKRSERFKNFVAGLPPNRLGRVEQVQLKADVCRLADLARTGGYGGWLNES